MLRSFQQSKRRAKRTRGGKWWGTTYVAEPEGEQEEDSEDEHEDEEGDGEGNGEESIKQDEAGKRRWLFYNVDDDEMEMANQASVEVRLERYPSLDYTARYCAAHARELKEKPTVKELMMSFAGQDGKISSVSQVVFVQNGSVALIQDINEKRSRSPFLAAHVLAYHGCDDLMSELLD